MKKTAKEWDRILSDFEKSGLNKIQYAKKQGVPSSTFRSHYNRWMEEKAKVDVASSKGTNSTENQSECDFIKFSQKEALLHNSVKETFELSVGNVKIHIPENFSKGQLSDILSVVLVLC